MAGPVRRSGRQRAPNPKYAADASNLLKDVDLELSEDEPAEGDHSENGGGPGPALEEASGSASDDSFDADPDGDAASQPASASDSDVPDGTLATTTTSRQPQMTKSRRGQQPNLREPKPPDFQHNRGLAKNYRLGNIHEVGEALAGPHPDEEARLCETIEHWFSEGILPSREGIASAAEMGLERDMEPEQDEEDDQWTWYYESKVQDAISRGQTTQPLSVEEGTQYYPPRSPLQKAVMGPYWHQTLFSLQLDQAIHLAEAWKPARKPAAEDAMNLDSAELQERNGWIINLGAKIQSISWTSNPDVDSQYLAVALHTAEPDTEPLHSAFEPTSEYKASIQIWRFQAQEEDANPRGLDPNQPPALVHVMCTEWGMCREIKWCPVPKSEEYREDQVGLGLMATIWSDGYVRVLDVRFPASSEASSVYVKYNQAMFASKPPQSLCTSVTWSSAVDLVAGCANGTIAVWDLARCLQDGSKTSPYLVHQLHEGFILCMTICLPRYPYLLMTAATDGFYRLCDLRNPDFDTVESQRQRSYAHAFDYCHQLEGAIAPDNHDVANIMQIRRFYAELIMATCDSRVLAVACGRAHPCTLLGCADGSVLAFNPVPGIMRDKKSIEKWETFWFKHEWIPETGIGSLAGMADGEEARSADIEGDGPTSLSPREPHSGISRITEAFEPRKRGAKKPGAKKISKDFDEANVRRWETIYEEPSAITQLEWNPSPRCGGWAAAGMGSGLLRVEDLAI